jgi:hypothetical protein
MNILRLMPLLPLLIASCIDTHSIAPTPDDPPVVVTPPSPLVVPTPPDTPIPSELPPLSVGVPSSTFDSIKFFTQSNDSGIQFVGDKPIQIARPEGTLRIPVGSRVFWKTEDRQITFSFKSPLPDVKTKLWGAKLDPALVQVRVYRDDSVQADVEGNLYTKTLTYQLAQIRNTEKSGAASAISALPVIYGYECTTACTLESRRQVAQAQSDFILHAEDLPFRVEWQIDQPPAWMPSTRPAFWIPINADRPDPSDRTQQRYLTGYKTLKHFTDTFHATRGLKVSAGTSARPFSVPAQIARPDRDQSRAVARIAYNENHNCPGCGREQYIIENEDGPGSGTHTHRCSHCNYVWYHADQVSSGNRSSKSRSFFGLHW